MFRPSSKFFFGSLLIIGIGLMPFAEAAIVFEDFNVGEGRFNLQPSFSGSSTNIATTSTADRVVSPNPVFEGIGAERLVLNLTTPGATSRTRFLAGQGSPGGLNTTFSLTAGVDGFIGFYLMSPTTNTTSWTATIALDGPTAVTAEMSQGIPITIQNDGQWRLYEWDLDNAASWQAVAGIGGSATMEIGQASIDSIILRGTAAQNSTFFIDFVAKSDSGTIANLIAVPEPSSLFMVSMALCGYLTTSHRRRR